MGEAKDRAESVKKQQEEFLKMLETPLTQEEGSEMISKIDMQKAQLSIVRLNLAERLASVDAQIAQAEYDRTIVVHRVLIGQRKSETKPVEPAKEN